MLQSKKENYSGGRFVITSVTFDQIIKIAPNFKSNYGTAFKDQSSVDRVLKKYSIADSDLRLCHFLAQCLMETGGLTIYTESMDYSAERMMEVWPTRFPTLASAKPYEHDQEKLANFVYGGRMGNSDPGDGFKFRGRGLLQITGREAYQKYGIQIGADLVGTPDLAFDARYLLEVAAAEWFASGHHGQSCNALADNDNIVGVTYAINGGQTGIADRRQWLKTVKALLLPNGGGAGGPTSRAAANLAAVATRPGPPPTFVERVVEIATEEWNYFGNQTYDIDGTIKVRGHKEGDDPWYKQVGVFWQEGCGIDGVDGRVNQPWSAVFISWVMRKAGAGKMFHYYPQHAFYISRAIEDLRTNNTNCGYWCYRLNAWKPQVGDIVCWARQPGIDYDHQNNGDYLGHCDIVVAVGNTEIEVIGGNVGDSVTRRPLALTATGYVAAVVQNHETLFGIMRCRL